MACGCDKRRQAMIKAGRFVASKVKRVFKNGNSAGVDNSNKSVSSVSAGVNGAGKTNG